MDSRATASAEGPGREGRSCVVTSSPGSGVSLAYSSSAAGEGVSSANCTSRLASGVLSAYGMIGSPKESTSASCFAAGLAGDASSGGVSRVGDSPAAFSPGGGTGTDGTPALQRLRPTGLVSRHDPSAPADRSPGTQHPQETQQSPDPARGLASTPHPAMPSPPQPRQGFRPLLPGPSGARARLSRQQQSLV